MLSRRIATTRLPLRAALQTTPARATITQVRYASNAELADPGMNGGYVNPPADKRQFRDPYKGWFDPQERRAFGEPVHEDNDVLGVFGVEAYTHYPPGKAALCLGTAIAAFVGMCATIGYFFVPESPVPPKEFPGDLEKELGGPNTVSTRSPQ